MKKPQFSTRLENVSPAKLSETREKFSSIEYKSKVIYSNASRYGNLRTIQDEDGKIYHESWFQKVVDYSSEDTYHTVTIQDENRLDIIANVYYGTPRYWWVIAIANYILDPFNVPVGSYLRIPPLTSLYNEGGVLGA